MRHLYGEKINNGTPFRRLIEEELIDPMKLVQIGIRGTAFAEDDLDWALGQGVRIITMDEFNALGRDAVIAEARRRAGDDPVYVTFDVDGLDFATIVRGRGKLGKGPVRTGVARRTCSMFGALRRDRNAARNLPSLLPHDRSS